MSMQEGPTGWHRGQVWSLSQHPDLWASSDHAPMCTQVSQLKPTWLPLWPGS